MILWMTPITDRSKSDVDRVFELIKKNWEDFSPEEEKEWNAGMKGALNNNDLIRIQNNIQLLSDVLELGLKVSNVPAIPNTDFFNEIISNTESIRSAYCIHQDTPKTPNHPLNDYKKWNDIEKILEDVYGILLNNFHYYGGAEIYCGDDTGLLL